jgi:hypothetical protein
LKKVSPVKFNGLLEWIVQQDGHEFLVEVDRSFIKDKLNLIGIREQLCRDLDATIEEE